MSLRASTRLQPLLYTGSLSCRTQQFRMATNLPKLPDVEKISTNVIRIMGGNGGKVGWPASGRYRMMLYQQSNVNSSRFKVPTPTYSAPAPPVYFSTQARAVQPGPPASPQPSSLNTAHSLKSSSRTGTTTMWVVFQTSSQYAAPTNHRSTR